MKEQETKKGLLAKLQSGKLLEVLVILILAIIVIIILYNAFYKDKEDVSASGKGDYATEQEAKLVSVLSKLDGVGKVQVMISLADEGETVIAYETVQKALWNEKLAFVLRRKKHLDMFPEARRSFSNIHDDVLNLSARAANEFGLGIGRKLTMQPAHDALLGTIAVIILNKNRNIYAGFQQFLFVIRLHKPAAVVAKHLRLDQKCTIQLCWY